MTVTFGEAVTNCPNCGAPLHGGDCEYCGTMLEIPVDLMIGKEIEIRFRHDGRQYEFRTRVDQLNMRSSYDASYYWCDGSPYMCIPSCEYEMDLQGTLVAKDVGGTKVLCVMRDE